MESKVCGMHVDSCGIPNTINDPVAGSTTDGISKDEPHASNGSAIFTNDDVIDVTPTVSVTRQALTVSRRRDKYSYNPPEDLGLKDKAIKQVRSSCDCSCKKVTKSLTSLFPILKWLPKYNLKTDLMGDLISGFTVAIMHIPQGMSYALLAELDAIIGIYMAFFPLLIYTLLGSSRHISIGTMSVICLMTGKVVNDIVTDSPGPGDASNDDISNNTTNEYTPLQVATIMSFTVGLWEVILGVLRLGSLSVFLSEMLVSGFSTGAAVHVVTSQVKHLLGISVPRHSGAFKIIYTWIDIIKGIPNRNMGAVITSTICITIMAITNDHIKPRVKKITKFPVPVELLLVTLGTVASYLGNFYENFGMKIVGEIPTGLPTPTPPTFSLFPQVVVDSFVVSLVSYTLSFSMGKIFSNKHDYDIDATQELYSLGCSNIFASFFSCAPSSACMSRSLVQEAVGGATQITSLVCCGFMLILLLVVGPLFETLPNCVLASIIVVALKGMFLQTKDMMAMWQVSRPDALIWLVTFLSVVVIDIDYGLLIGVAVAAILLLMRNQALVVRRVGRVAETDIYLDIKTYPSVVEHPGLCICEVVGSLHFANREEFKKKISSVSDLHLKVLAKENKIKEKFTKNVEGQELQANGKQQGATYNTMTIKNINHLIIDLKSVSSIDLYSSRMLAQLQKEYNDANINVVFSGISEKHEDSLNRSNSIVSIPSSSKYHAIQDAVVVCLQKINRDNSRF